MLIEHPILNRPYDEPGRHFAFDDEGVTDRIEDLRRPSSYFAPVPRLRKGTASGNTPNSRPTRSGSTSWSTVSASP